MQITLEIAESAALHFGETPEVIGKNLLLKAAIEDYREGRISEGRFAEIIGVSRWEAEEILDKYQARHRYTLEMLEADRRNLEKSFGDKITGVANIPKIQPTGQRSRTKTRAQNRHRSARSGFATQDRP